MMLNLKNLFNSFLYFLLAIPIIFITILILDYIEHSFGFHTFVYKGDLDIFYSVIIISTFGYLIGNSVLYKNVIYKNILSQHILQSFFNYLVSAILFILLLLNNRISSGSIGYAFIFIFFMITIWGAIINLIYLLIKYILNREYNREP